MSEMIQSSPELLIKRESERLYEAYGGNENRLYPDKLVLDLEKSPEEASNWVMNKLAKAKLDGKLVGVVAGAFDVPQENHDWYLRHSRYLLAEKYLKNNNLDTDIDSIRNVIESDLIYLVVSIDTDAALDNRKSNDPNKGGVRRPIYGWTTRANRIASHNVVDRNDHRIRYGIADLVIAEGPEYQGTILQQAKFFAATLHQEELGLVDEYIVFDEHPHDIENAKAAGFDPLVIPMDLIYSYDPISGKPYKSSSIIKRIRGEDDAK